MAAALCFGKGTIVSANPTYDAMLGQAEKLGTKVVKVPLTADYSFDLDAMEKAIDSSTSLVYICNPNNPTGTFLAPNIITHWAAASPRTLFIVDEAYLAFTARAPSVLPVRSDNMLVLGSLTKEYALAGLRLGYAVGSPEVLAALRCARQSRPDTSICD